MNKESAAVGDTSVVPLNKKAIGQLNWSVLLSSFSIKYNLSVGRSVVAGDPWWTHKNLIKNSVKIADTNIC